jgi:2-isopropylmalate synthase
VLCDTNGGMLPPGGPDHRRGDAALPAPGPASTSTTTPVRGGLVPGLGQAGARQVQGCVNGYGERTGNADLCSIIPDLAIKMDMPVVTEEQLAMLSPISHHIAEVVNITLDPHRPYVGASAFTHKAGLHTSALARRPDAYEHTSPSLVGNHTRMVVSEQAGRASIVTRPTELAWR